MNENHQPKMSYYIVVKHDYATTKDSVVTDNNVFTDKLNAMEYLQEVAYNAVVAVNGVDHANKCIFDEKRLVRKQAQSCIEKKYYITKNAIEAPDQLIVWRKYDVTRSKPGRLYGTQTWLETVMEKQFSVSVVRVPSSVWGVKPQEPIVTYTPKWLEKAKINIPKGTTEDEFYAKEHREINKEYSEFLKKTAVFGVLNKRLTEEEIPAINLPKIRYENPSEFNKCSRALVYVPASVELPKTETKDEPKLAESKQEQTKQEQAKQEHEQTNDELKQKTD